MICPRLGICSIDSLEFISRICDTDTSLIYMYTSRGNEKIKAFIVHYIPF